MTVPHGAPARRSHLPRSLRAAFVFLVALGLAAYALVAAGPQAHAAATLLSQGKTATASSVNAGNAAANAVDGNAGTRWESAWATRSGCRWTSARPRRSARSCCSGRPRRRRRTSSRPRADGANWTTIYSTTTGPGGTETLNVTGTGRYVRMAGSQRDTGTATACGSSRSTASMGGGAAACGTTTRP